MADTSTIPAATAAIKAAWEAATPGASVTDGPPSPGVKLSREWVMLGDVRDWSQEYVTLGRGGASKKEETYTIEVLVDVLLSTRKRQADATARAFAILGELEDALRADPALSAHYSGAGQLIDIQVAGGTLQKRATSEEREAALEVFLRVRARI